MYVFMNTDFCLTVYVCMYVCMYGGVYEMRRGMMTCTVCIVWQVAGLSTVWVGFLTVSVA